MFTPASIPISFNPLFFVVAFFLGFMWSGGNITLSIYFMGIVLVSVFVHEMGHALSGIAFNQKVAISFLPFGGLTERRGRPLKHWEEFIVVIMGPLFGFTLYLLASFIIPFAVPGIWKTLLIFTATVNFYWTFLNLLPVLPLDGGHLMRIILQSIWQSNGLKIACFISMLVGAAIALWFILKQDFFIASFFAIFVYESWQMYSSVKFLKDEDSNITLQRLLTKGQKAKSKGEEGKAHGIFSEIRNKVKGGLLYNHATLNLAEHELKHERTEVAYSLLYPIRRQLDLDGLSLFHETALKGGHWQEALETGSKIFEQRPSAEMAIANSRAAEKLGNLEATKGWQRAYHNLNRE